MQALHRPCLTDTSASLRDRRQSGAAASTACRQTACRAKKPDTEQAAGKRRWFDLQDLLGPIGLALQAGPKKAPKVDSSNIQQSKQEHSPASSGKSIHTMTTAEWRAAHEETGGVDLWVEEEFNAGSRLKGGRDAHKGHVAGYGSGEGPTAGNVASHRVKIHNRFADQEVEVDVPEDRYILWEAEEKGLLLPYACRMGCCTACAVKIKSGRMYQPQSLGVSAELKQAGYGLMCVGYAQSDLELETVPEDEVYDLQFGRAFAEQATDPNNKQYISRDDFARELADMDE